MIFYHSIPEDMLLCYSKIQEIFIQKIISKDLNTGLEIDRGFTDEIVQETLEKFRDFSFKKGAVRYRYQVQYLRQNLRKPRKVSVRACGTFYIQRKIPWGCGRDGGSLTGFGYDIIVGLDLLKALENDYWFWAWSDQMGRFPDSHE